MANDTHKNGSVHSACVNCLTASMPRSALPSTSARAGHTYKEHGRRQSVCNPESRNAVQEQATALSWRYINACIYTHLGYRKVGELDPSA